MSAINIVKYYFYAKPKSTKRMEELIALAYQTARDRKLYPKAVLIRSEIHDTTTKYGKRRKDPKGFHVTIAYKDAQQLADGTHVASHGYCPSKTVLDFVEATHDPPKPDSTLKLSGNEVWPEESDLFEAPDVGYSHLDY
ncbi:hypothetical protein PT974_01178 [Cladobotryum mycophilum]|uniref:Uncharacterized protein n=1 Tax=Cladobotryum mycophilum TaxID=491253 RepID=A0ABR0T437_9HYPO